MPWEETFYLNLFHFHFRLCGGTASGSFFSTEIPFPHPLSQIGGLLFNLLEFHKGVNMHIDKREHTDKIQLDFLKPLTIFS